MKKAFYKRLSYEDAFDRRYCCYWKRDGSEIKRINRRLARRKLKVLKKVDIQAVDIVKW